ncbi:hypothetical protein B0H17DRAFT_1213231 [Mycena rosella]|uniref:Uncharacterized protein n=1 Tax=Mycena rosella TaxID=1033263 RepID=A0AAD7G242_MYCRO|nr:hypothetical protein B0H17DRAFT_1213231 [Mycena rosella]
MVSTRKGTYEAPPPKTPRRRSLNQEVAEADAIPRGKHDSASYWSGAESPDDAVSESAAVASSSDSASVLSSGSAKGWSGGSPEASTPVLHSIAITRTSLPAMAIGSSSLNETGTSSGSHDARDFVAASAVLPGPDTSSVVTAGDDRRVVVAGAGSDSRFPDRAAGIIGFSVPTTDVQVATSVDCQWTATPADPATFSLVMQFSDLGSEFGDIALVTIVRRGDATSGTVPSIQNVHIVGCVCSFLPAAAILIDNEKPDLIIWQHMQSTALFLPFDATFTPFAFSPTFNVVNSTCVPDIVGCLPGSSSVHLLDPPRILLVSPVHPFQPARSKNHSTIIIAVSVIVAALVVDIATFLIFLRHRRKSRTLDLNLLRGEPFPAPVPERLPSNTGSIPPPGAVNIGTPQPAKEEISGARAGADEPPPPAYCDV